MRFVLVLVLAIHANLSADNPPANDGPVAVLQKYVEAVKSGDWESAESCWKPHELRKSRKLGIQFKNTDAKYDCASNLMLNREEFLSSGFDYVIKKIAGDDSSARMILQISHAGGEIPAVYYARYTGDKWYLISPLHYHTSGWKTISGDFIGLHVEDAAFYNDRAIYGLDSAVYSICEQLKVPGERIEKLSDLKIDYYLCGKESFRNITGATAEGMVYIPMDAVISRHIFHLHELSHLLVNYALEHPNLYTVPFFQEGLAVYLGGRWGKAPDVMADWGVFMIRQDLCRVEEILSYEGFYSTAAMPDITYPVAGLFCKYVIEKYGMDKFIKVYKDLSGSFDEIRRFDNADIKSELLRHLGHDWHTINSGFTEYVDSFKFEILRAGSDNVSSVRLERKVGPDVKIGEDDEYYHFRINVPDSLYKGALLLYADGMNASSFYKSSLFDEQFGDFEYDDASFGILFDCHEIGLYDYTRNYLTAKYIRLYQPDMAIFDPAVGCIKFRLRKGKLPHPISDFRFEMISR